MNGLNVIVKLNAEAQRKFDESFKNSVRKTEPIGVEKKSSN
jgi:hypothetical protein